MWISLSLVCCTPWTGFLLIHCCLFFSIHRTSYWRCDYLIGSLRMYVYRLNIQIYKVDCVHLLIPSIFVSCNRLILALCFLLFLLSLSHSFACIQCVNENEKPQFAWFSILNTVRTCQNSKFGMSICIRVLPIFRTIFFLLKSDQFSFCYFEL